MNIAVDTNVLARAILMDDPEQGRTARKLLTDATTIAIATAVSFDRAAVALLSRQGEAARLLS